MTSRREYYMRAEDQFGQIDDIFIDSDGDCFVLVGGDVYKFEPVVETWPDGTRRHYDFVSTDQTWEEVTR